VRVFPGEQDLSALYQKVAAKTEGFDLSTVGISGDIAPNKIQPLTAPAVDEGIQFYSGG